MDPARKRLVIGAVVLGVVAFALGWAARGGKPKVEFRERVVTKEVEVEKLVDRVVEKRVIDTQWKYRTIRTSTTQGDRIVVTEDTRAESDSEEQRASESSATKQTERAAEQATAVEFVQTPAPRKDWRVSPMIGLAWTNRALHPVAGGLMVERHIVGPLHIGAWALSSGQAGVAIGAEF